MYIKKISMKFIFFTFIYILWCSDIIERDNVIHVDGSISNLDTNDELDSKENLISIETERRKTYLKWKEELQKKDTIFVAKTQTPSLNTVNTDYSQNHFFNNREEINHYSYFECANPKIINTKTPSDTILKSDDSNLYSTSLDESDTETSNISSIYSSSDLSYEADIEIGSEDFYSSFSPEKHNLNSSTHDSTYNVSESNIPSFKNEYICIDAFCETKNDVQSHITEDEKNYLNHIETIPSIDENINIEQRFVTKYEKNGSSRGLKHMISSISKYFNGFLEHKKLPTVEQKGENVSTGTVISSNGIIDGVSSLKNSLSNFLTTIKIKILFGKTKAGIYLNTSIERITMTYQSVQMCTIKLFNTINIVIFAARKILKINDIFYISKYIIIRNLKKSEDSQNSCDNTLSFLLEESVGLDDSVSSFTIDEDLDLFFKNIFKGFMSENKEINQMKSRFREIILKEFKHEIKNKDIISIADFITRLHNKDTTLDVFITANFSDFINSNHLNELEQNEIVDLFNKCSSPDQDLDISRESLNEDNNFLIDLNISKTNDSFLLEDLNENVNNNSVMNITEVNNDLTKQNETKTEIESSKPSNPGTNDDKKEQIDSENDIPLVIFVLSFLFVTILISLVVVLFKKRNN